VIKQQSSAAGEWKTPESAPTAAYVTWLKKTLNRFKVHGTDGCKTCDTGRVTLFIANEQCTECDPEGYQDDRPTESLSKASPPTRYFKVVITSAIKMLDALEQEHFDTEVFGPIQRGIRSVRRHLEGSLSDDAETGKDTE